MVLLTVAVHGTVSGTSPTLQIGKRASQDGTNFWENESLTTSITATASQQQDNLAAGRIASANYLQYRAVLTGTSPSFAGTYVTIAEVLEP